jgi:hypothetical protein
MFLQKALETDQIRWNRGVNKKSKTKLQLYHIFQSLIQQDLMFSMNFHPNKIPFKQSTNVRKATNSSEFQTNLQAFLCFQWHLSTKKIQFIEAISQ